MWLFKPKKIEWIDFSHDESWHLLICKKEPGAIFFTKKYDLMHNSYLVYCTT